MTYFQSLTESNLIELVNSAKSRLYICLPSIHKELADAITEKSKPSVDGKKLKINILIDFDANTFRQGYGNSEAVQKLLEHKIDVKSFSDNRISFFISDEVGYYLFIESRSLIPADKATINAIGIDPVSLVRLKKYFFSGEDDLDYEDELSNAIIQESKQLADPKNLINLQKADVQNLNEEKVREVVEDLKQNPPLNPDYKRIVDIYSTKFQYVKLKFEGANLKSKTILLPKNALGIGNVDLKNKIESKLKLFDPKNIGGTFEPLEEINSMLVSMREKFLTKVRYREESIIERKVKDEFLLEKLKIEKQIKAVKNVVVRNIADKISMTKGELLENLVEFYKSNPDLLFSEKSSLYQNDEKYVQDEALRMSDVIIHKINWPVAHHLLEGLKIDIKFSDITFEDLKNEQFLKELFDIGLIDLDESGQLAEFSKAISI